MKQPSVSRIFVFPPWTPNLYKKELGLFFFLIFCSWSRNKYARILQLAGVMLVEGSLVGVDVPVVGMSPALLPPGKKRKVRGKMWFTFSCGRNNVSCTLRHLSRHMVALRIVKGSRCKPSRRLSNMMASWASRDRSGEVAGGWWAALP